MDVSHSRRDEYEAPPRCENERGETRRVGLEVEIGGLSLERTLDVVQRVLGGVIETTSRTEGRVRDTPLGTFKVEFDHSILRERSYLRPLALLGIIDENDASAADRVEESVLWLASEIVPVEIVAPPVPFSQLAHLDPLWEALRDEGAEDTHASLLHAFGLHLNPETPGDDADTLLSIVRAYLLLEDWLKEVSGIDISRKISPFIRAFPRSYRRKILAPDYAPTSREFADDYLTDNPTRNRPLDLHPLLVHMHGAGVLARMEEANLVRPRPTFHYRLPNCEIGRPGWTPAVDWNRWVMVERLASDATMIRALSAAYLPWLELTSVVHGSWVDKLRELFTLPE